MATKKSTKTAKTKTSKTAKTTKMSKAPRTAKSAPAKNTKFEPHRVGFGLIMVLLGFAAFLAIVLNCAFDFAKTAVAPSSAQLASEYSELGEDNVFEVISGKEAIDIIENKTGVVFLGFPSCPWCQAYLPMLNTLAKEHGVKKVYYHSTYDDWKQNTEEYKKLTELLSSYLQTDDAGAPHLYVPNTVFVKDGEIVANDLETSKDTLGLESAEEYWTEERVSAWKERVGGKFERGLFVLDSLRRVAG